MRCDVIGRWTLVFGVVFAVVVGLGVGTVVAEPAADVGGERPLLLLVEPEAKPTLELRWPTASGGERVHTLAMEYAAPGGRVVLADGIEAYVALGGSRLDKGVADPWGLICRVGIYRAEGAEPIFRDIEPGGTITLTLAGVRFNQAVDVDAARIVQHVKFTEQELEACGLVGAATDLFNTTDELDPMRARMRRETARHGYFAIDADATNEGDGPAVRVDRASPREAGVAVAFPYTALRHPLDPSRLEAPGAFQEPSHFHVEFEAVPAATVDAPAD